MSSRKVERITTDVLVTEKIKEWIEEKQILPGQRLPSEQEMCEELGVGRHTLREGIKRLSQLGIVESRTGVGTFVCEASLDKMYEYLNYHRQTGKISAAEIYDVRRALESYGARLAAFRAGREDKEELRATLEKMRQALSESNYKDFVAYNLQFHLQVAKCSKNEFLVEIILSIKNLINATIDVPDHSDATTMKTSLNGHEKIFAAIERGDPDAASAATLDHLHEMAARNL